MQRQEVVLLFVRIGLGGGHQRNCTCLLLIVAESVGVPERRTPRAERTHDANWTPAKDFETDKPLSRLSEQGAVIFGLSNGSSPQSEGQGRICNRQFLEDHMESCGETMGELVGSAPGEMSTAADKSDGAEASTAARGSAEKYLYRLGAIAIVLFLLALAAV